MLGREELTEIIGPPVERAYTLSKSNGAPLPE
jgi:hypothetical protein